MPKVVQSCIIKKKAFKRQNCFENLILGAQAIYLTGILHLEVPYSLRSIDDFYALSVLTLGFCI